MDYASIGMGDHFSALLLSLMALRLTLVDRNPFSLVLTENSVFNLEKVYSCKYFSLESCGR